MTSPQYTAYWLPGLNDDSVDPDEVLRSAFEWLQDEPGSGARLIVMDMLQMVNNRPIIAKASARYTVVSPRSQKGVSPIGNAVLSIWPANHTLELAENLARGGSLCVIPGTFDDLGHWIFGASAQNLWNPGEVPGQTPKLEEAVRSVLDSIIYFGSHNDFLGGTDKQMSIRNLRAMISDGNRPDPTDLENYVLTRGVRSYKGARRLREWYEGLLEGRKFRNYGRRLI